MSAECKERGELLGIIVSHLFSLNELKAGFESEERLADMQSEYLSFMASKEELQLEFKVCLNVDLVMWCSFPTKLCILNRCWNKSQLRFQRN